MRILLCGYHEAGYRVLRTLIERRHDVVVATHAASPEWPNVAALARSYSLETIVDDADALERAAGRFAPDAIFSVYYRHIIPVHVLALARRGAYNFHPSLLPRHRGCFSAPWAIIEGDRETGVTCHRMIAAVDAGAIVDSVAVPIRDADTGMSLFYKLVDATVDLFPRVLEAVIEGTTRTQPQTGPASFHPRGVPHDGIIDHTWPRALIERFIRALYFPPYAPAAVVVGGVPEPVTSLAEFDRLITPGPPEPQASACAGERDHLTPAAWGVPASAVAR
jgi:GDP-perosamine N-formyltransferase